MSSAKQNHHIARLIVGAMSIDGTLEQAEREKVAAALSSLGLSELIANIGAAIDDAETGYDLYHECDELLALLGAESSDTAPLVFRLVCDVLAADRFVSEQEALYMSAMARRLRLGAAEARQIFKAVLADRRARIEISGRDVNEILNAHLKELLSFEGADALVCDAETAKMLAQADDEASGPLPGAELENENAAVSGEELQRAFTVLGLTRMATLEAAEQVWRDTIQELDLPKMARMGETFVSAALNRMTRINEAYKTVLRFNEARKMKLAA